MKNEHRRLTWKYFLKRKSEEICNAKWNILTTQIVVFFMIWVIFLGFENELVGNIILSIVLFEFVLLLVSLIAYFLIGWINSNWELATQDATLELKRRLRKK